MFRYPKRFLIKWNTNIKKIQYNSYQEIYFMYRKAKILYTNFNIVHFMWRKIKNLYMKLEL